MLEYDYARTKTIVSRLTNMVSLMNAALILFTVLLLGTTITIFGIYLTPSFWWVTGLLGFIVGYGIGRVLASFANLMAEAAAQTLVAQGVIWLHIISEVD
jgi:presenilin-like A22 family membrane protease